jgi:hypothetical protein
VRERLVGGDGSGEVLDVIEELGDITAPDRSKFPTLPRGQDMVAENALDVLLRAKSPSLDVTLEPLLGDGSEALPSTVFAALDLSNGLSCLLAGVVDRLDEKISAFYELLYNARSNCFAAQGSVPGEPYTNSHGSMRTLRPNSARVSVIVYLPLRQKAKSASRFASQSWRIASLM